MKIFGIDVSTWQKGFNFKAAKAEGVKFAILRGAYSAPAVLGNDGGMDRQFESHYKNAKAEGLGVGCYQYSMATTVQEAEAEAAFMCDVILKNKQFDYPIYIDIEDARHENLSADTLTAIAKAWCRYMEKHGYWAGIYSSLYWFRNKFHDDELQGFAHWVAQWAAECTYEGKPGVLGMWQFGGSTNVIRSNQIAGVTCDQNYALVDYPSVIISQGKNGYKKQEVKPTPAPAPETPKKKTNEEVADAVIRGEYGNNPQRKAKIIAEGYDYEAIQKIVDEKMSGKKPAASKPATSTNTIGEGSKVRVRNGATDTNGTKLAPFVYNTVYTVLGFNSSNVALIGIDGKLTAAVNIKDLYLA